MTPENFQISFEITTPYRANAYVNGTKVGSVVIDTQIVECERLDYSGNTQTRVKYNAEKARAYFRCNRDGFKRGSSGIPAGFTIHDLNLRRDFSHLALQAYLHFYAAVPLEADGESA